LFDIDQDAQEKLQVKNGLYNYFLNSQQILENLKINLQENLKEISLIAYTEKGMENLTPDGENIENILNQNDPDGFNLNITEKGKKKSNKMLDNTIIIC